MVRIRVESPNRRVDILVEELVDGQFQVGVIAGRQRGKTTLRKWEQVERIITHAVETLWHDKDIANKPNTLSNGKC